MCFFISLPIFLKAGTMTEKTIGKTRIVLVLDDITKAKVDAIVNAANPSLLGGGGVDGAIHRAGGHAILKECKQIISKIGRLAPGKAVITTAGTLPARYVIHTVGPIWRGGKGSESRILTSAYRESLALADKMDLHTVAFPSLATGAYGYPVEQASATALAAVQEYLLRSDTRLELIQFSLFSRPDLEAYASALERF